MNSKIYLHSYRECVFDFCCQLNKNCLKDQNQFRMQWESEAEIIRNFFIIRETFQISIISLNIFLIVYVDFFEIFAMEIVCETNFQKNLSPS